MWIACYHTIIGCGLSGLGSSGALNPLAEERLAEQDISVAWTICHDAPRLVDVHPALVATLWAQIPSRATIC